MNTPFENAMSQLDRAAGSMQLDAQLHARLRKPEKLHIVSLPVLMDDGSEKIFVGYRSQFNSILGLYKGGIRFADSVNADEVKALSFWMAIKTAAVGLPLGGGKGGVCVDPRSLSSAELERVSRAWVRALYDVIGPEKDVPAPDVATNPRVMGWMVDEYNQIAGVQTPAAFTGKDVSDGGVVARATSTSRGGFYLLEKIRQMHGKKPADMRVAIQGFGNAGMHMAQLVYDAGYTVVGVSDSRSSLISDGDCGIDPYKAQEVKKVHGSFAESPFENLCKERVRIGNSSDVITMDCDVLIPAAVENQITVHNAMEIQASLIIELANGPTTPEADRILEKRGVQVIPDVLANAGGVIVSYYEWYQNMHDEQWSEDETNEKLRVQISDAYMAISALCEEYKVSFRDGAFIHALLRMQKSLAASR